MEEIDEQYITTTSLFNNIVSRVEFDIERSKYPLTIKAIYRNSKKIDYILDSLIHLDKGFYVSQILTRVLFEHYFIGQYLCTKLRFERTDKIGEEYYKDLYITEWFKQENYYLSIENIKSNKNEKINLDRLKKKYPEFHELKQNEIDNINKTSNQFDIRKIGSFLKNQTPKSDPFFLGHSAMVDFLNKYNELSSYVHGGPTAEKQTFDNKTEINSDFICNENIQWGKIASRHTKENLMMSLSIEFTEPYLATMIEIREKRKN